MHKLATVVIPAAGLGTRMLPATKSIPKELLPVYDRPLIQFAVDEAVAAGARRIVIVLSSEKRSLRDYFRHDDILAGQLRRAGKTALVEVLGATGVPKGVDLKFVEQDRPLGLGHAVLCAVPYLLPGPFGVLLPDDLILGTECLPEMASAYTKGHMIAASVVPEDEVSSYGIFIPATPGGLTAAPSSVAVRGMVEKPRPAQAPSRLAAVGRYILDPCIAQTLTTLAPGAGGEIQLTDAISDDNKRVPLTAFRFTGQRHDCGWHQGLLTAAIARQSSLLEVAAATSLSLA